MGRSVSAVISFIFAGIFVASLAVVAQASEPESYVGIGITLSKEKSGYFISDTIQGGPADKAGVSVGDILLAVDGKTVEGQKLKAVVDWIAGNVGTDVTLTLSDNQATREVTITRELISIECYMKGSLLLTLTGDSNYGNLVGSIGGDSISVGVSGGRTIGNFKGIPLYLTVEYDYSRLNIYGYIQGAYVNWLGSGNYLSGYQSCIY